VASEYDERNANNNGRKEVLVRRIATAQTAPAHSHASEACLVVVLMARHAPLEDVAMLNRLRNFNQGTLSLGKTPALPKWPSSRHCGVSRVAT
jgi:hypothetical protein